MFTHRLQRVVELTLLPDSGPGFLRHILAAHRTSPVRRIDFSFIRKLHQFPMETVVQQLSHLLWRESSTTCEIRTTNVAYEKRIARQYFPRLWRDRKVCHEDADALRRVSRRLNEAKN